MLIRTVERHPEREALVADGRRWTYEGWNARINQAANSFFALGIRPLDRVVICVKAGEAGLTSFMACQKLGAIAVPVNVRSSQGELSHILQHAGAHAIV
jgi:fatty-acyl-CoA synthase